MTKEEPKESLNTLLDEILAKIDPRAQLDEDVKSVLIEVWNLLLKSPKKMCSVRGGLH